MPTASDLDAGATLRALESEVLRRRQAEVDDLQLVLHFADLHDAVPAGATPPRMGGERLRFLGGDGTPGVAELAIVELDLARGMHTLAARRVVADGLDLRHRLPRTWAVVRALEAEVWLARRVATMSRALSADVVCRVDDAVAEVIGGHAPSQVLAVAEAAVIAADQAAHDKRIAAERRRRFVHVTRPDAETGHQAVIGRVTTAQAAEVVAAVQQVADLLAVRGEHADLTADELRAEAFAWLARPDDVAALRAGEVELKKRTTKVVLFVHLHQAVLDGQVPGIARVEGLGPHTMAQLRDLLGHSQVTVKPVLDLADRVTVDAYEHPAALKERIALIWGGDAFPHATRTGRTSNLDVDHIEPYEPDGPPGQTATDTSQPLARTAHRAKTHLGYRCRRVPDGGEVVWRTPQGLCRPVDHTGTHHLTQTDYDAWTSHDPLDRALVRIEHRHRTGTLSPTRPAA